MRNALAFHISLVGRTDLSGEIYRQIKAAILEGRLHEGDRVSPTRELSRALKVSRMTVTVAYERLAGEGWLESRQGAGTYVSGYAKRAPAVAKLPNQKGALKPRPIWGSIGGLTLLDRTFYYDFRTGHPDGDLFPHRTWERAVIAAMAAEQKRRAVYQDPSGRQDLRNAIVQQIGFSRSVKASAEQVVVTNGTQQALDLLARVLLSPGDIIVVEDPGYGPPRQLFNSLGLRVVGVPVDEEGLIVEALPREARAIYITPSHQYPLGMTMSLPRRRALLAWARDHDAAIFEDDYDSEFRFEDRPCEPLQTLDTEGRVIYIGSFSKTLLPTLRIGFLVAPPALNDALRLAKLVSDWQTPSLVQAAVARFMDGGGFARHIRKMTRIYRERRELLIQVVQTELAHHLRLIPSVAGLHVATLARHATPEDIVQIVARAGQLNLGVHSVRGTTSHAGLMLAYGSVPAARIREGLQVLGKCFDEIAPIKKTKRSRFGIAV